MLQEMTLGSIVVFGDRNVRGQNLRIHLNQDEPSNLAI